MTLKRLNNNSTMKLGLLGVVAVLVSGCAGMMEEHRRAMAIQHEAAMSRAFAEYAEAPVTRPELWQMPSQQAIDYKQQLEELAGGDISGYLAPADAEPVECDYAEDVQNWLVFQTSSERLKRSRANTPQTATVTRSTPEITLISGDCSSGELQGEFVALYSYNHQYNDTSASMTSHTEMSGRIEGAMKNGALDGEVRATNRDVGTYKFGNGSPSTRTIDTHSMGRYESGQRVGSHVTLSRTGSGDALTVNVVLDGRRELGLSWLAGEPNTRYHTLDGQLDGYMNFANATLSGSPTCYRGGQQQASTAYCDSIEAELEASTQQALLQQN